MYEHLQRFNNTFSFPNNEAALNVLLNVFRGVCVEFLFQMLIYQFLCCAEQASAACHRVGATWLFNRLFSDKTMDRRLVRSLQGLRQHCVLINSLNLAPKLCLDKSGREQVIACNILVIIMRRHNCFIFGLVAWLAIRNFCGFAGLNDVINKYCDIETDERSLGAFQVAILQTLSRSLRILQGQA